MNTATITKESAAQKRAGGLGRSLGKLEETLKASQRMAQRAQIPCNRIKILPQIRSKHNRGFTVESLTELGMSIKNTGQYHPIGVRPIAGDPDFDFELIYGERRVRGSVIVELPTIDAFIWHVDANEAKAIQRMENTHAEGLDDAEKLEAVKRDFEELKVAKLVAERWGKPEAWISKILAMEKIGEVTQQLVEKGLTADREVLAAVGALERIAPELTKRLVNDIAQAPAEANVRTIVAKGVKEAKTLRDAAQAKASPKAKAKLTPERALDQVWVEVVDRGAMSAKAMEPFIVVQDEITAFLKGHFQDGKKAAQKKLSREVVSRLTAGTVGMDGAAGFALIAFLDGATGARFGLAGILDAAAAARAK